MEAQSSHRERGVRRGRGDQTTEEWVRIREGSQHAQLPSLEMKKVPKQSEAGRCGFWNLEKARETFLQGLQELRATSRWFLVQ